MRVRELLAGAAVAATLLGGVGASASPLNFGGYSGPVLIKFNNYESFSGNGNIAVGDVNFGVVKVTSITDLSGNNVWLPGGSNGFLSGIFANIEVASINPTTGGFDTTATGGVFNFWQTSATFNPGQGTSGYAAGGCAIGGLCYNGITNTGGADILNLALVPGTTTDPANTLSAFTSSLTLPTSGHAEGFADVTGGADAGQFAKGGFPTNFANADIHFLDNFCGNGQSGCTGPASNWQLFSSDPVSANIVPEPGSLALLGMALVGFGSLRRSRRSTPRL